MRKRDATRVACPAAGLLLIALLVQPAAAPAAGLTYIEKETGTDPNVTPTMDAGIVTPDGQFVITVGGHSVFAYRRDSSTGELDCEQEFGLGDIAIGHTLSPDGKHLYVSVDLLDTSLEQIRWFDVASTPGEGSCDPVFTLSGDSTNAVTEAESGPGTGVEFLDHPYRMQVSPDGNSFVAVSENHHAIHVFARNNNGEDLDDDGEPDDPSFGDISLLATELLFPGVSELGPTISGLKHPRNAVFSADSAHLYAVGKVVLAGSSSETSAVGHWSRNKDGELDFKGHIRDGESSPKGTVDGLANGRFLLVDPDPSGNTLHVPGTADDFTGAVAHLERDPVTGALSFLGVTTGLAGGAAEGIAATCLSNVHVSTPYWSAPPLTTLHALGGGILGSPEPNVGPTGAVVGSVSWLAVSPDSRHVYAGGSPSTGVLVFEQASGCGDGVIGPGEACDPCPPASGAGVGSCCNVVDCTATVGAACSDGTFCNGTEVCSPSGECVSTGDEPCTDTCSTVCEDLGDSCQPDPVDTACDDGAFCNGADVCDGAGSCTGAGNPCTELCEGICDEDSDACLFDPSDTPCSDGLICNGSEFCDGAGNCESNGLTPCGPVGWPCTTCTHTIIEQEEGDIEYLECETTDEGTPCDDGAFCNGADVCDGSGSCTGTGSPCTELCESTCDEDSDACLFDPSDTSCSDGLPCNGSEFCDGAGNCESNGLTPCGPVGWPCTTCWHTIIEGEGGSTAQFLECETTDEGTPCDDGDFCNGVDQCDGSGGCIGAGDPCIAGGDCNDVCDEAEDWCLSPAGSSCTSDGENCTDDVCDGSGTCAHIPNFAPCEDDGLFCNGSELCGADGTCSDHSGNPCADAPECVRQCDEVKNGCVPNAKTTPCSEDGFPCTVEQCNGKGKCVGKTKPAIGTMCRAAANDCDVAETCKGGKACPKDEFLPVGTSCSADDDACTDDTCGETGNCELPATDCDDENPCTVESCDSTSGCSSEALPDGTECESENPCVVGESCLAGSCVGEFLLDSDGDGYCDEFETSLGCNREDFNEIPWPDSPEKPSLAFPGSGAPTDGNSLVTWDGPSKKAMKLSFKDELGCVEPGQCDADWGFCTRGLRADPCAVDADCQAPELSCRLVARWSPTAEIDAFSASLRGKPFKKLDVTALFGPQTPGCARKVDLDVSTSRRLIVRAYAPDLNLKDIDRFRFIAPKN